MTAYLAIETSSNVPAVALSIDGAVVFNSATSGAGKAEGDLGALVAEALAAGQIAARDLTAVAVDIGPGGLGAVRSGVAFANALTYGLNIPVRGFNLFEIAGRQLAGETRKAVLSVVPAAGDNVYLGLYRGGVVELARFGEPQIIAGEFDRLVDEIWAAGRLRCAATNWLPDTVVHDSGVEAPDPATLLSMLGDPAAERAERWTQVEPLTETSAFFDAKA